MSAYYYSLSCILAQSVSGQHSLVQRDMAGLIRSIANEENQ